jgi:hypothetical protein
MAQYCYNTGTTTNCTDRCESCAKEMYRDLKGMTGKAEYVSEEAIRNDLGDRAFEMLREFGYIEYCTTIQGRKMYAI